jgi:putative flippase GtrA
MRHHFWRLVRYSAVGIVNTVLYIVVLYALLAVLKLPETTAATLAYIFSISFYYSAHRYFTFRSTAPIVRQIYRLLPATALNYLISLGLVAALSQGLMLPPGWVAVLAGTVTAAVGYFFAYLWVFADGRRKS